MIDKKRCTEKAIQLGADNYIKYTNCAQATFTAILDALREEGIELTSTEAEEAIFKALSGVSGGHANLGCGNCGALSGAATAISLVSGVSRSMQVEDKNYRWIAFDNIAKTIGTKFKNNFHGLTCRNVTWERYGKLWDFWNVNSNTDFLNESKERGYMEAGKSTVSIIAGWGAAYVVDILENPRTLEQIKVDHNLV